MFASVLVGQKSLYASLNPPNSKDCSEILLILNQGKIFPRIVPQGQILSVVQQVQQELAQKTMNLVCHTVAKNVANKFSIFGYQRVTGYLIKNSIDINFLKTQSFQNPPDFTIDKKTKQVNTWLHHHSVVRDSKGDLIECLPIDWYPDNEFVFVPHSSGEKGYFLYATY